MLASVRDFYSVYFDLTQAKLKVQLIGLINAKINLINKVSV